MANHNCIYWIKWEDCNICNPKKRAVKHRKKTYLKPGVTVDASPEITEAKMKELLPVHSENEIPFKDEKVSDAELIKLLKEKCVEAERYSLAAQLREIEKEIRCR